MVNLEPGAIQGVNITAPGTSGFISASGEKSRHLDDQFQMFVDFTYKPVLFYDDAMSQWKAKAAEMKR